MDFPGAMDTTITLLIIGLDSVSDKIKVFREYAMSSVLIVPS